MLSMFHSSKRFTTKLAPNIVVASLCKLLNLSKGLYGGVHDFFFLFDPPPSTPEDLAFFTIIHLLSDQIDWPESIQFILTGRTVINNIQFHSPGSFNYGEDLGTRI